MIDARDMQRRQCVYVCVCVYGQGSPIRYTSLYHYTRWQLPLLSTTELAKVKVTYLTQPSDLPNEEKVSLNVGLKLEHRKTDVDVAPVSAPFP